MAEIIASGTTEASSSDFSLIDGQTSTLYLKNTTGNKLGSGSRAVIQIKSGSVYFAIGELDRDTPAKVLAGIGTYRVTRLANTVAFGVDRD